MRTAARAIIVKNQSILVMHRNKFGRQYYCLVGGGVDVGETADIAVVREVREETGLQVTGQRLVYIEEAGEPYGTQYHFLCEFIDGDIKLSPDSIEAQLNKAGQNLYEPVWLPISKLASVAFRSETLQKELLAGLRDGFPSEPKLLRSGAQISRQPEPASE